MAIFPRKTRFLFLPIVLVAIGLGLNYCCRHSLPTIRISWQKEEREKPFFTRKHQFDCRSSTDGSRPVTSEYEIWNKVKDCSIIRHTHYYPTRPNSDQESSFPLAYTIMISEGLEQLEMLFNAIYAPQNYYCFHVDFRAHFMVHDFVRRLAGCFDGDHVFVSDQSVPIASTSVSVLYAQRACFIKLIQYTDWRYVLTIDGSDFPLRTNGEIVQILSLHRGANDVELVEPLAYRYEKVHRPITDRYGHPIDMEETTGRVQEGRNLKMYKGNIASALSREFVRFQLNDKASMELLSWLTGSYMPSELYASTLNHNDQLNPPGGYPGKCVENKKRKSWISRFTIWNTYKHLRCNGDWRKGKCVFGIGDVPLLEKRPELFAHEFDMKASPVVIDCLHERIFNRTYRNGPAIQGIPYLEYYKNLSAVQYQSWRMDHSSGQQFQCPACDDCEH